MSTSKVNKRAQKLHPPSKHPYAQTFALMERRRKEQMRHKNDKKVNKSAKKTQFESKPVLSLLLGTSKPTSHTNTHRTLSVYPMIHSSVNATSQLHVSTPTQITQITPTTTHMDTTRDEFFLHTLKSVGDGESKRSQSEISPTPTPTNEKLALRIQTDTSSPLFITPQLSSPLMLALTPLHKATIPSPVITSVSLSSSSSSSSSSLTSSRVFSSSSINSNSPFKIPSPLTLTSTLISKPTVSETFTRIPSSSSSSSSSFSSVLSSSVATASASLSTHSFVSLTPHSPLSVSSPLSSPSYMDMFDSNERQYCGSNHTSRPNGGLIRSASYTVGMTKNANTSGAPLTSISVPKSSSHGNKSIISNNNNNTSSTSTLFQSPRGISYLSSSAISGTSSVPLSRHMSTPRTYANAWPCTSPVASLIVQMRPRNFVPV